MGGPFYFSLIYIPSCPAERPLKTLEEYFKGCEWMVKTKKLSPPIQKTMYVTTQWGFLKNRRLSIEQS